MAEKKVCMDKNMKTVRNIGRWTAAAVGIAAGLFLAVAVHAQMQGPPSLAEIQEYQNQELPSSGTQPEDEGSAWEGTEPAEMQPVLESVEALEPGTVLDASELDTFHISRYFTAREIQEGDAVYQRIIGKSYRENPDIGLEQLRYLTMLHYNFEEQIQVGEMIVNEAIAQDVLDIFRRLFENRYQIQSMYLVDNYWTGDGNSTDTASIDANNTSAFNYRPITGGGKLSNHAYGRAIDVNPQQNPYVWHNGAGGLEWSHSNADGYIDRTSGAAHMITHEDLCYQIFAEYGFGWGGDWSDPIDYQHFEKKY